MSPSSWYSNICGPETIYTPSPYSLPVCFREVVLDTAVPFLYLLIAIVFVIAKKKTRNCKRAAGYSQLHDYSSTEDLNSSETVHHAHDDDDLSSTTTVDPEGSSSSPQGQQQTSKLYPALVDLTKFILSAAQAASFFALSLYRSNNEEQSKFRVWSVEVQSGLWALVSLVSLTLLIRTIVSKRRTTAVLTTNLLNSFYVVFFIFAALPRIYDAALERFDDTDSHRPYYHEHYHYTDVEFYAAVANAVLSFALALFFGAERRTRKVELCIRSGRVQSGEVTASRISQLLFSWVDPLIMCGYKRTLNGEDLWELREGDASAEIIKRFRQTAGSQNSKKRGLVWRMVLTFKRDLIVQAAWGIVWAMFSYTGPFFLNRILAYVEHPGNTPITVAYLYTFGLLAGTTLMSCASSQALWIGRRICIRLKGIVMGEVFMKTLKRGDMSGVTAKDEEGDSSRATRGQVTNMISVDVQKISEISAYIHYVYSCPIQIFIGAYFLWSLLRWSALIGLSVFFVLLPVNIWFSQWFEKVQGALMKTTDKRISLMGELLHGIRIVKFFAWEKNFYVKIMGARDEELAQLRRRLMGWVFGGMIWYSSPVLITVMTFVAYTKIFNQELSASVAFTSLALFNSIRMPLDMFPEIIMSALQCRVSITRIEKFLEEPEIALSSSAKERHAKRRAVPRAIETSSYNSNKTGVGSLNPVASYSQSMGYESFGAIGTRDRFGGSITSPHVNDDVYSPLTTSPNPHTNTGLLRNARAPEASTSAVVDNVGSKPDYPVIGFRNASFRWFSSNEEAMAAGSSFSLRNLDIDFPIGEFSIIAGPTGSGKTSILMALLGEMCPYGIGGRSFLPDRHNNRVINPDTGLTEGIAYVAQQAWLQCVTIRENILFGQPFDQDRYNRVIFACALSRDLEILEAGDQTEVGEKGITLSGGQKQRVALARALYSRARHVLLDDCLSAVDSHTAKHILEYCLLGDLMKGRTRILVTHHVGLCLRGAAHVVVVHDGRITAQGSPQEVVAAGALSEELFEESQREASEALEDAKAKAAAKEAIDDGGGVVDEVAGKSDERDEDQRRAVGKLVTSESKEEGSVKLSVYGRYFQASGGVIFWVILMMAFGITQLMMVSQDFWLRLWAKAYDDLKADAAVANISTFMAMSSALVAIPALSSSDASASVDDSPSFPAFAFYSGSDTDKEQGQRAVDVNYYLGIYCLISLAVILSLTLRNVLQFWGSLRASRILYSDLLQRILRAPIRFFDTTPIGRIINRFSKDFETIDQQVSGDAGILLMDTLFTLTVLIVITAVTPWFAIAAILIIATYSFMGSLYLKTSRELKRVESVSKSPCFSLLDETVVGVTTIRAFGEEKSFIEENFKRVDAQLRPFIWIWAANRWLSIRVDMAGAMVSFFASCFVLAGHMDAGLAGFCLTYALMFTDRVLWVVRLYSMNEMNLNSVERVQEYLEVEQEPPAIIENNRPPASWPEHGGIEVMDLVLRYSPDLPPVLNSLTFEVKPGEKVGIVGRTGAGKSTLALAFFRFVEASSGKIFIDGIDISKLGLEDLRSRLTIIPQDPVLFSGTIRSNLDPFGEREDAEIWAALRRAHLVGADNNAETDGSSSEENAAGSTFTSLDAAVSENGANFSQGQRQLLAMARALIKNSKVIILDEATASVDFETDANIQTTVKEEFSSSTLIVIAHRLRTVVEYDKILVLDRGRAVEYGTPYELMTAEPATEEVLSAESGMKPGLFRSMCERTGTAEYEALLEMARPK